MSKKMRDAINSVMSNYDLTEASILRLIALGAQVMGEAALLIDRDDIALNMKFVYDHALGWSELMEGSD